MKFIYKEVNYTNQYLSEEGITTEYKDVFRELGCFKNAYDLTINTEINPIVHAPRRVPITLKAKLKTTLDTLVKNEVIAPVSEPTKWVSSLVLVEVPKKLRMCLDPKDLNKAILRSHYPMSVIDEIPPDLTEAKIFSVVDAKDGFW